MRKLDLDSIPHLSNCLIRMGRRQWSTFCMRLLASWWGVDLGKDCLAYGLPRFRRYPRSRIIIGPACEFNSSAASNLIGVNRPCILSTLSDRAKIQIGSNCGFSGTVIGCSDTILIGDNVRCGANTLITDTDWHTDDPRTNLDTPVLLEKNVWLGVNVIILKGVSVGENTLVAAGSVVTRTLPSNVIAGGNPAKVLRTISPTQQGAKQ